MRKPHIDPRTWTPPTAPDLEGLWSQAAPLDAADLLPVPGTGPEDVAVDGDGDLFTGLDDGRVIRMTPDGRRIQNLADTGGRPLGIEVFPDGSLLICDAHKGLLHLDVTRREVTTLVAEVDGLPLRFTNNAAIHPDGSVLFTDSSQRFGLDHFKADLLEHSCTGRLLRWRDGGGVEVLVEGLAFANGVTLTHGGDAAVVAETGGYRLRRHWLVGPRAGQTEVLVDNLPGFPDNLSTGPSGTVWVALPTTRNRALDLLLPRAPWLRQLVWALPEAVQPAEARIGFVVGFDQDGRVTHNLQGPGDHYHYVTGVREHDGRLYLGSLREGTVATVALPDSGPAADVSP